MRSVFLWPIVAFIIYSFAIINVSASSDDNDVNQNNEDEEEEGRTGTIIGIDLGTTYSECSFVVIVILLWTYSFICIYTTHRKNWSHLFLFLMLCSSSIPHVTGCVGVFQPKSGSVEIIPNDQGNRITPSYVAFTDYSDNNQRLVGDSAKNQATLNLNKYNLRRETFHRTKVFRSVGTEW